MRSKRLAKKTVNGRKVVRVLKKHRGKVYDQHEESSTPTVTFQDLAHVAHVGVNFESTLNLGEFNSAKVGVFISMPCRPNTVAVLKTHKKIKRMAERLVSKEISRLDA